MSRYYDEPIKMVRNSEPDGNGTPVRFVWRGRVYQVLAVLARWHLRDRWWAREGSHSPALGATVPYAIDRHYWRLHCASPDAAMVFCVVYEEAEAEAAAAEQGQEREWEWEWEWEWRLERVYD